ncbi:phosphatidate cytidylyltransferase [Actibacterium mucosum KCTC 23349]|uniref:Phosphatidate cytidylyltransferase n=1 Tax=Actibacterium mucosum KCTC 23349 TaxID=1454373 RepID=A0A037ZFJ2_9RHOB|nr:phosphatidate cytidylyltransferase [Actibacterium mucosum]KAJ54306.1 phosphatidate cytidylyltransferase [Actibacterium mucosum KCTC 23349]
MSAPMEFVFLLAGVLCVLIVASMVAFTLKSRLGPDKTDPVIENLVARVNAWWAMVALLSFAMLAGRAGAVILFALLSFAAMREFLTLTAKSRADHYALAAAFYVVLPFQYYLIWIDWYGLYSIFIPVYAFLFLPIIAALRGETENFLTRVSETQWGLMICVFAGSHVPALMDLNIPGYEGKSILLIAFLVAVVQGSDVLQYVFGKLMGRHKIAPVLSPSKTWEGFLGGVLTASLLGAGLWWMTPFTMWQAFLMALMIAVMGFFGGLVMSAIKRDKGVKDWGHLIAGHGGFIDRLDSVVFSAPIFFHVVRYFWAVT